MLLVFLEEDSLHPVVPRGEVQGLLLALQDIDIDSVVGLKAGAVLVCRGHVDDAETESVELPVFCLAVEVGTAAWRSWSSQLDLNLLQVLHDWADEESTWALDDQLLDVVILEDFHRLSLGL